MARDVLLTLSQSTAGGLLPSPASGPTVAREHEVEAAEGGAGPAGGPRGRASDGLNSDSDLVDV